MSFWATRWDDGSDCVVEMKGDTSKERNALLCDESPINLVSWNELWKAGWKSSEDIDYIYHPKYRVTIFFENIDGLAFMPLVVDENETNETTKETFAQSAARITSSFLSTLTKYYVIFGGPDITRFRKTGEIVGLKLGGDAPPPIREFVMATR